MKTFIIVNEKNEWVYYGQHENADEAHDAIYDEGIKMVPDIDYYIYELANPLPVSTIKILSANK